MLKSARLAALLFLLFCSLFSYSQTTCATATTVTPDSTCSISSHLMTGTDLWLQFTASTSSTTIEIHPSSSTPNAHIQKITVYSGSCAGLTQISTITLTHGDTIVYGLEANGLTSSNTYYVKLERFTGLADAVCATPTTNAYIGVCVNNRIQRSVSCSTTCGLVPNYSFETLGTAPYSSNPFGGGHVNCWGRTHGTPQISTANPKHLSHSAIMWHSGAPSATLGQIGEGVYTNLSSSLVIGSNYVLTYYLSRANVTPATVDSFFCKLTVAASSGFPYQGSWSGSPVPNPPFKQTIDQVANISSTSWMKREVCFTAGAGYNQIYFYPKGNTTSSQQWAGIDSIALKPLAVSPLTYNPASCNLPVTLNPCGKASPSTTYSWTPSTGLSCTNCPSPVATLASSQTYTVTITAPNGCSATNTVTVTVPQATQVSVSPAQAAICIGQSVQLTASNVSSYSWLPSAGLSNANISNPVASPTAATTYTVTGTDNKNCITTATASVTVNPLPVCGISSSTTSACPGSGTYTTTTGSNYSYSWSVSSPGSVSSGQNTNSITTSFPTTTSNYTVTVVTTHTVTGCQNTCTYFVGRCCTPVDGLTLYNDTSSNHGTTFTGLMSINGLFVVDNACTFQGVDLKLGYNARILILPGASLTITDNSGTTSKLYACDYMWDGIYISGSTASLTVNRGSSIEDAQNAIVSSNGGVYTIGGTPVNGNVKLNKNYKNIVVNSYSSAHTGTVTGTTISCNNGVTIATFTTTNLRPPHLGERTYVGMEINSVTNSTALPVGSASNTNLKNTFDNMDYGIIANNSNVTVKNNEFKNITSPAFSKKITGCPIGTAICARGNSSVWTNGRTLTVGGSGSNEPNTIKDGGVGIDAASNLNMNVTYNTFRNLSHVGITAARNYLKTVTLNSNTFKDIPTGIYGFDLRGSTISMSSNSMNMKNKNYAQGIIVAETFPTSLTRYTINSNTIDTVRNGIEGSTLIGSKMNLNTVRLKHTPSASAYGRGIFVKGGSSPNVHKNTIYGQNRNDWWIEGIRVDLSNTDTVTCNSTNLLGAGEFFSGVQPFTYFAKNDMTDHLWGLMINAGEIGTQGVTGNPNDNTWNGSFSYSQTHAYYSDGSNSPFNVQNSSQYYPTNNTRFPNQAPQNWIPFNPVLGSSSLNCTTPNVSADQSAATDMGILIAEGITYPAYSDENAWLGQWALYNYIKQDSSLLDDPAIDAFYTEANEGNLALLYNVLNIMGNMDGQGSTELSNAQSYNSAIDPQNDIELNWQAVNNILIANAINAVEVPSDGQLEELLAIAQKCPLSDGPAVYIARSILTTYDTSYVHYENECERPDTSTGSGSRLMAQQPLKQGDIKLYPNPNNGDMLLACELAEDESGDLVIYDLTGKQVAQFALSRDQQVMPLKVELTNGIYLYRVTVNGEMRKTDKLVIVK